ncbi:MAG: SseB family protein [Lachnospiraceae bacterium]|nr:SseB family protein [Lachnospiraceae bacterium]
MGLFNRKKHDTDTTPVADQDIIAVTSASEKKSDTQSSAPDSFVFGVEDISRTESGNEVIVTGRVKGTVKPGDVACIINPGDDNKTVGSILIAEIRLDRSNADIATDTAVGIRIAPPEGFTLKIGSVCYSNGSSEENIYKAYITALTASFFAAKHLVIEPDDLSRMSIGDLAEIWNFVRHVFRENKGMPEETRKEITVRVGVIAEELIRKLLSADEIFYVNNKRTGEPHLFSHTLKRENRYECLPPAILIIPESHIDRIRAFFEKDDLEIRSVKNGEDGKGIYNFLGSTFYLNGACGVHVLSRDIMIDASKLVEKPTYEGIPAINVPVTNPDLMRWLLLMGQMHEPETDDARLIHNLYFGLFLQELPKAKLLVPMKGDALPDPSQADKDGNATLKKGAKITFPSIQGKKNRRAVQMFTDWKRLYNVFNSGWSGMVETISNVIEVFDCVINATDHLAAGCYIDKDTYDLAVKKSGK